VRRRHARPADAGVVGTNALRAAGKAGAGSRRHHHLRDGRYGGFGDPALPSAVFTTGADEAIHPGNPVNDAGALPQFVPDKLLVTGSGHPGAIAAFFLAMMSPAYFSR